MTVGENINNIDNKFIFTNNTSPDYFNAYHLNLIELIINCNLFDDDFKVNFNKFPKLEKLTIISNRLIYNHNSLLNLTNLKYLKIDIKYPDEDCYKFNEKHKFNDYNFGEYLKTYKFNGETFKNLKNIEYLYYSIKVPTACGLSRNCLGGKLINMLNKQDIKTFKYLPKLKKLYVNSVFCGQNKKCNGNCSAESKYKTKTTSCTISGIDTTSDVFGTNVVYFLLPQLEEFNKLPVKPTKWLENKIKSDTITYREKLNNLEKYIKKSIKNVLDTIDITYLNSNELDVLEIKNKCKEELDKLEKDFINLINETLNKINFINFEHTKTDELDLFKIKNIIEEELNEFEKYLIYSINNKLNDIEKFKLGNIKNIIEEKLQILFE